MRELEFDILGRGMSVYHGPVDEHGNPVRRTKREYPYSYDGFVLRRMGPNSEVTGTVYSDRLYEWDYEKTVQCAQEHLSGRFATSPPDEIEAFLRDRLDAPDLRLILVMEYCNLASGYPVWRFDYATEPNP